MRRVWECRRTFIALMALICLTVLGLVRGADVAPSLATVALAIAACNAAEKSFKRADP